MSSSTSFITTLVVKSTSGAISFIYLRNALESAANKLYSTNSRIAFLSILNTIKLYHWNTHSYATHKATDELYSKMNEHIDTFVEVLLGKTGDRVNMSSSVHITLKNCTSEKDLVREMERCKTCLVNLENNPALKSMSMSNSDLFNIRDEILADINQFLYLLTFK